MINIKQHPLRAFEQDPPAFAPRRVERRPGRPGEGEHEIGDFTQVALQPRPIDRRLAEAGAQRVVVGAKPVELRSQFAEISKVADPDRAAADLVLISGADAAPGGADLALTAGVLAQRVEIAVDGKDQRAGVGDHQVFRSHRHALAAQRPNLRLQRPGIEHHAVADHRQRAAHDPRGQQRELVDVLAHDQRMTGIMAALEADDEIGAAGQPVDDLALALVAPLAADHGDVRQVVDPELVPASSGGPPLGKGRARVQRRLRSPMNETLF